MTAVALDDVELEQKRVKRMMSPMERLARVVSQRLEHTIVSERFR